MNMLVIFAAVATINLAAAASAPVCAAAKDLVIGSGHNLGSMKPSATQGDCCALCQHTEGCKAWTWHTPSAKKWAFKCALHSSVQGVQGEHGAVSGVPTAHMPPGILPPPPPPPPPAHNYPSAEAACAAFDTTTLIMLMHGFGWGQKTDGVVGIDGYTRNSGCGNACGRPYFRWDNGPQGFGDGSPAGNSTQWPSSLNIGATFDPSLALEWGQAMGAEFWGKGTNIQEGPGLNIARIERNGRTFEYLSGEDPVLGGLLGQQVVDGIQEHVMAIAKHYIENNQETDRSGGNMLVDEVTMMELYAPPFAAVADRVAGYMCSYNRVNGVYACENKRTLSTMLKGYFNFSGFVVSDWGATHSTSEAINAGLDIDMPNGGYFNQQTIHAAIAAKNVSVEQLHNSCLRIMRGWYALPEAKRLPCGGGICIDNNVSTPAHKQLARKLSAMSTVLLKNEGGLLPLSKQAQLKIALIGADASAPYTAGQGSGGVRTNAAVSPLVAFQARGAHVTFEPAASAAAAAKAAAEADVAIVFGSAHSSEGHDRSNLLFATPTAQAAATTEEVIAAVSKVQKKTVVVAAVPGQILTDWRADVAAILVPFLPGEQYGNAIADIIFGDVTPQAKLPVTFPGKENEQGMTVAQWPGVNSTEFPGHKEAHYSEGQIVGYRWYDKHGVTPAYPFGFGLTYGPNRSYSALRIAGRKITFQVAGGLGPDCGCDTPQIYLGSPKAADSEAVPKKVLRAFQKTCEPAATISYTVTDRDVSNWSIEKQAYVITPGVYDVYVGSSSQDIHLAGSLTV